MQSIADDINILNYQRWKIFGSACDYFPSSVFIFLYQLSLVLNENKSTKLVRQHTLYKHPIMFLGFDYNPSWQSTNRDATFNGGTWPRFAIDGERTLVRIDDRLA